MVGGGGEEGLLCAGLVVGGGGEEGCGRWRGGLAVSRFERLTNSLSHCFFFYIVLHVFK